MSEKCPYDISNLIGPLDTIRANKPWPMYSYERPADIVWTLIARQFRDERHWRKGEIQTWLQSRSPRWALDAQLGDRLAETAMDWAREFGSDYDADRQRYRLARTS